MYKLLCDCWGYLIVLDIGHAQGMLYLDLQVQFCTKHGKLANVHIIAILLFTNKTAETLTMDLGHDAAVPKNKV